MSTASLGRWIKTVLQSSGIDTSVFKTHSVRGASTSALYNRGVTISKIMNLANWSNEHVFHRLYNRSNVDQAVVGRIVLSDI